MHKMNKNAHNYAFLSLTRARYPRGRACLEAPLRTYAIKIKSRTTRGSNGTTPLQLNKITRRGSYGATPTTHFVEPKNLAPKFCEVERERGKTKCAGDSVCKRVNHARI